MRKALMTALALMIMPWSGADAPAAHTPKQQCINTCRARYRDCRHLNQLPSWECRGVYRDCTRYKCTGLGPG